MDLPRGLVVAWALSLWPGFTDTFNMDTRRPRVISGPSTAFFGYTVQQHEISGKKWLVVGAPLETNGHQKTGDVYKCPVIHGNCTKLNLGRVTLSNVSERKDNMRLGLSLATNPKDNSFLACSPLWSHECGSSYYTTGMCSRVNSNFRFSKTVAPALQRCQTYMDIVIVLDGSNSIYPWVEVQHFLINILKKFYIGPGQIQVGVVQYGEDVVHEFHLNDYRSVKDVVEAASHIEQRGGTETRTALGIEFARSEAFQKGGRKGAKKVMIVITDGESHDSPDLKKVIQQSERDNVTRYAVAVLGYYNRRGINPETFLNEIKYIASDPDEKHFFNVTDEAALKDIVDALGDRIFSLEGTNKNETSFGLEMSQTGFSSHVVEDGILLGAVGAYDWNGAVLKETSGGKVIPHRESYLKEFPEELKNHGAYLGYTVTSVVSSRQGRVYVAGAPRFNHTGKVILFTMHNNQTLTIHQALRGEQIGSYYGSEITSVDIDGDGVTDILLVGAPMYFSEGRERGKVYIYNLRQSQFVYNGTLKDSHSYQNARFGASIASVRDLNQDSYNDVVVGAPLEDNHGGVIYIFHGFQGSLLKKPKQRISASELAPGLQYFGCSIHGQLDLNEDGLVDLAVGALGNAVILWSRPVLQINASLHFEPPKINIFHRDCKRSGRDATCLVAFLCFTPVFLAPYFQMETVGLRYNATMDERRYTPRAHLDEGGDRYTHRSVLLSSGQEHCERISFHVLDTADYVKPVTFSVEYALEAADHGPMLDDGWPTTLRVSVPFWNGCNEDEHCVPDLVLDARSDLPTAMEYCQRVLRKPVQDCSAYTLSFDTTVFIIESTRRRVAVEAMLENRGENAYSTALNISQSANLQFASLIQKDDFDGSIECVNEERRFHKKVCNVSYPFFRAKAKVSFRLDFEFSKSVFLHHLEIQLAVGSDSDEQESTKEDNTALLRFHLKYEADILFTRRTSLSHYEVKSNSSLERYDGMGPPFNSTFKIQNLGLFPIHGVMMKITVPIATRGGSRLLMLKDVLTDQGNVSCNVWGNSTEYRRTPAEEDLSHAPQLNHSNSDVVSINCNVRLAPNQEINFHLLGNLWLTSLKALKYKSMKITVHAALQRQFHSPFIFREEDPSRQIVFEISKQEDMEIPIWIILGSTLGGLLLLALLVLALWKVRTLQVGVGAAPRLVGPGLELQPQGSVATPHIGLFLGAGHQPAFLPNLPAPYRSGRWARASRGTQAMALTHLWVASPLENQ
ncbi:integrin alpha-11 isoform X1 [Elephas maximus indicus]|uniref:integrin alpha-11 isoform X1 n=1 Tax=Elephas maximus indicus TaxID=99487 RepID=UPI002116A99E|nr:integrin alpha-11 isoform X1 [Elephas maximus indicus]